MPQEHNELLQAALNYAALGIFVFPLRPGGKSPAFKGWLESSTTDAKQIKAWWTQNPAFNIGIDCGKSGLVAIDYDAHGKPGLTVRDQWRQAHTMPDTWTARTPRGGLHEYYKGQAQTKTGLYDGVDVRAAGGLVVAPPSVFDGKLYTWEKPPILYPLADADSSVYTFLSPLPENFDRQQQRAPYTIPDAIQEGQRTSTLIAAAGSLRAKGFTPEAAEAAIRAENDARCNPPLTEDELQREVFPALTRSNWTVNTSPFIRDAPIDVALLETVKALDPAHSKRYGQNDAGSARLFVEACGDTVRYAEDRKRWLFYDGRRWNIDGDAATRERLKALADALALYTLQSVTDEGKRTDCLRFYGKWQQLRTRQTILQDAQSIRPCKSGDFDADPYLLNCQNGVLNLRTFDFKPHSAADMLSKMAAVDYNPAARCARWEAFIDEITGDDNGLAVFIQKCLGYSLTGATQYETFFLCYGPTSRNGKSTLLETFARMLGDYAAAARPETLAKKKYANGSGPTEDVARLAGVRFVSMSEPPKNMELDAALLKSLTGRDTITARRLNEGSFEFLPSFKLFMNSNHRPRVEDISVFKSDRIRVIPFTVHFSERRRDPELKGKLSQPESLSAVLNWAIEGLRMLQSEGFTTPDAVSQATAEYQSKEDKTGQFLTSRTETGADYETPLMQLHSDFASWCMVSGLMSVGVPKFRELLEERQIAIKRKRARDKAIGKNPIEMVLGLRLLPKNEGEI